MLSSGNTGNGIRIGSPGFDDFNEKIEVVGNYIGVDKSGITRLPNISTGISVATGEAKQRHRWHSARRRQCHFPAMATSEFVFYPFANYNDVGGQITT